MLVGVYTELRFDPRRNQNLACQCVSTNGHLLLSPSLGELLASGRDASFRY